MKRSPAPRYVESGPVLVRPESLPGLARADTLIFDIDGVLMDVSDSIRAVDCDAVHAYLTLILGWPDTGAFVEVDDVEAYKLADGFNDDWELTGINVLTFLVKAELTGTKEAARLRATPPTIAELAQGARESRGGVAFVRERLLGMLDQAARERVLAQWDYPKIVQIFQELYAGQDHCYQFYGYHPQHLHVPGRIALDRPLIRPEALPPGAAKLGIYSGRTWQETRAALDMAGIAERFTRERVIVVDDGMVKPDPRGLTTLVERMSATAAVFVGDMPDDREAVRRYRAHSAEPREVVAQSPPAAERGHSEPSAERKRRAKAKNLDLVCAPYSNHPTASRLSPSEPREARPLPYVYDCLVLSGPLGDRPEEEIRAAGADVIAPDVNAFLEWWGQEKDACAA